MSNDKVVGTGGDGKSSHREIVSRHCAVKLGRNNRNKRQFYVIHPLRKDWVAFINYLNNVLWNSKSSMEVPMNITYFPPK